MRHTLPWALLLLSFEAVAAEPCAPVPNQRLAGQLDDVEQAFAELDSEGFVLALDNAALLVPCLDEVISPSLAARYHRLRGLYLYTKGDKEKALYSFTASTQIERGQRFDTALIPPGHEVLDLFEQAAQGEDLRVDIPEPLRGYLSFDGIRRPSRPEFAPSILQHIGPDGEVLQSMYLLSQDDLPSYQVSGSGEKLTGKRGRRPVGITLLASAAAAAVTSGILYGTAIQEAQSFRSPHPEWDLTDLERQKTRTNRRVVAAAVTGGVAVAGLGVGVVLVR